MLKLEQLRHCFEGVIPSCIATCDVDGTPNVSYVSQTYFVDPRHIALTFQFFNKTHKNIGANPQATLLVVDPRTAARYRLALLFQRTETGGPVFESMRARLNSIAHSTHMEQVFKLRGADIYRVLHIEQVPGPVLSVTEPEQLPWFHLRGGIAELDNCENLETLFETLADAARRIAGVDHAMVLILENRKLFTIHSAGYRQSGIGAEIPLGCGVIGISAEVNTPIRITQSTSEYNYVRFLAEELAAMAPPADLETDIAYPGLPEPRSQLALPISAAQRVLGVVYLESPEPSAFDHQVEDALVCLCQYAARCMQNIQSGLMPPVAGDAPRHRPPRDRAAMPIRVRHVADTNSIFIDNEYLIKGVAGAVLWRLLSLYVNENRSRFTNKEMRSDACLGLPDIRDNFETRLILLRRRLEDRSPDIRIRAVARGTFSLEISRPIELLA